MRRSVDQRSRRQVACHLLVNRMTSTFKGRRERGFTLVEMMAVVAVSAILLAIAAPGMSQLLETQRLRSAAFDLISDLTLARNESLKRATRVSVKPTNESDDWSAGWRVLVESTGEVVRQRSPAGGTLSVSGAPLSVTYDRNCRLAAPAGVLRIELDSAALSQDAQGRCISIDPLGRARSDVGACS
jgi:type IV fimbrial biogenesis protein FimT